MSLRQLKLLDTDPEERYDRIVQLAAKVFNVPISYIALVDSDRQWFKAQIGMCSVQTDRSISFCGHAILQDEALVVPDAHQDERFAGNPLVTGEPFVRFYAGQSVRGPGGQKIGTLCLVDRQPRKFSEADRAMLSDLSKLVEHQFSLFDMIEAQDELLRVKEELLESKREIERLFGELSVEKEKTEDLLHNILPREIAGELKEHGKVRAVRHERACVLFTDFTGFTALTNSFDPEDLVAELNECFTAFDGIMTRHEVEKLKTIGDGYMCATCIRDRDTDGPLRLLRAAFEIRDWVASRRAQQEAAGKRYWDIRIGIHSGPVVAGVVGKSKFAFDIWGDTVNTAARMESGSEPGRINITWAYHQLIQDHADFAPRGALPVKGKDDLQMFFVERLK